MLAKLEPSLKVHLPSASKIYIATALINDYGYQVVANHSPENCDIKLLVGIDLPSDATVLRQLFLKENGITHQTRIYNGKQYFHPKVYLIENHASGDFRAFVGSANTTAGGLKDNVEMSIEITDPAVCQSLLSWFEQVWQEGDLLTQDFLDGYRTSQPNIQQHERSNRARVRGLRKLLKKTSLVVDTPVPVHVAPDQFFRASDFEAYDVVNELDHSPAANQLRRKVWERLKELHRRIFPKFKDYGLNDIYPHSHSASQVSNYFYRPGFTRREMRSMWTHYGYGKQERSDKFGDHPRLQVILHHHDIGIWLVIGKDHGSYTERIRFKEKIQQDENFKAYVFRVFEALPEYKVLVNQQLRLISEFADPESLSRFLAGDAAQEYFMVRKEFSPDDPEISDHAINDTILEEFARLYPLYLIFRSFRPV